MTAKAQIVKTGDRWKDDAQVDGGITIQRKPAVKRPKKQSKKSTSKK